MPSPRALRARAADIRKLGETSSDPATKWQLTTLADQFEQLADDVERMPSAAAPVRSTDRPQGPAEQGTA